jgi:hypothetical protein
MLAIKAGRTIGDFGNTHAPMDQANDGFVIATFGFFAPAP